MRQPDIMRADDLIGANKGWPQAGLPDGRYVAARPLPFFSIGRRWRAAWLVLTGKADALVWQDQ